jgi:hypothetical protein
MDLNATPAECLPMSSIPLLAAAALALAPVAADPASGAPRPALQLRLSSRYDADQALRAAGVAHTALERGLSGDASSAAIGFLCGMQPSTQTHGAAGSLGVDTEGRFLGAQLRFGFR